MEMNKCEFYKINATKAQKNSSVRFTFLKKIEFHKINVAKAQKNSSVRRHCPRLYIRVAQQCTSGARCPP